MSGVASIGSCVKLHAPSAATPSVSRSTSHRCAIAARTSRSRRVTGSVVMRGTRFLEIGLDHVALRDDDLLAGFQAVEHFCVVDIAFAESHASCRVRVAGSHEYDGGV